MTKIKKTILDYKSFKNILAMFTSSSSEDFFLAVKIWQGCKKNITLNTIIARHIGKTEYKKEREMHKRLLEFTKIYNTFNLDTTFYKLINKMREEVNDTLSIRLIKEEVKYTVNTLIDYHNLLDIIKLEIKNIKI
jgi:hypothetical protein|tara:strand:- start:1165 stop:1569 length:405 start_codon:yes stop_codon:yes gene_type:complete